MLYEEQKIFNTDFNIYVLLKSIFEFLGTKLQVSNVFHRKQILEKSCWDTTSSPTTIIEVTLLRLSPNFSKRYEKTPVSYSYNQKSPKLLL